MVLLDQQPTIVGVMVLGAHSQSQVQLVHNKENRPIILMGLFGVAILLESAALFLAAPFGGIALTAHLCFSQDYHIARQAMRPAAHCR